MIVAQEVDRIHVKILSKGTLAITKTPRVSLHIKRIHGLLIQAVVVTISTSSHKSKSNGTSDLCLPVVENILQNKDL